MSPTRSGYKELGLELVSLEEKRSDMPKRPLMVGEKKYDGERDPLKMFLEESLTQKRNEMMDSFAQILWWLPIGDMSSLSGGAAPFKETINFNIPIFEGHGRILRYLLLSYRGTSALLEQASHRSDPRRTAT
jgi:hypothetical protein